MHSKNPYTRSAFKHQEPSYPQYPQDDYYYEPQSYPYYQQPPPQYYQQQSYHQQPQYEQPMPIYYEQPYPPYQATQPTNSFMEPSLGPFSNYYGGEGMITDIEYLDFPSDLTYKRTPLNLRKHNKLNSTTRQNKKNPITIFFSILLEQLNSERQIEELKRKLVATQDFHAPSLFQFIDQNKTQNIIFDEFFQGLQDLDIKVNYNQLLLVYNRFSEAKNKMSLQDFEKIFLPNGQTSRNYKYSNTLGPKATPILKDLIKFYQANEQRFENSRDLLQKEGINIEEVYQKMDTNQSRNIGLNEFMNALNFYSAVKVLPQEASLLFMRFDKSGNGTISLMEFKREMACKLT
ncbi:unnamed protein product [Paramecium sonneborni]|uniref:EF-hand domain-containing protein n=1 Tax=Paramecium sonneborni TaxID=65129 RepID=A0A8S1MN71_9CILI|nr:unnamed protein product [Paramecium sonneborni]